MIPLSMVTLALHGYGCRIQLPVMCASAHLDVPARELCLASARSLKPARPATAALLRAHLKATAAGAARSHRLLRQLDRCSCVISTLLVVALLRLLASHPAGVAYRCRFTATRGHPWCASGRLSTGSAQLRRRARATSSRTEVRLDADPPRASVMIAAASAACNTKCTTSSRIFYLLTASRASLAA